MSTSNGPAATVPYARKQLLLNREAPAVSVPAVSSFVVASTKSLKLLGTSHSDDSCRLIATSANSSPDIRLMIYNPKCSIGNKR